MKKRTAIALLLTAVTANPAMAHLLPKDFGTFTGLTNEISDGATHTGLNHRVEGNFGWIDGTDSDWGDTHDLAIYTFAITDAAADVTLRFQRKANILGVAGLIPGFSLYQGSVHLLPDPPDHDSSEGSVSLRDQDCAATPGCVFTEGSFRALNDFRITNDEDLTGSDASVLRYIGHAYDGPSQTIGGTLIGGADGVADGIVSLLFSNLSPNRYVAFVGGVDYANQTDHPALGVGGVLTITPTAVPIPGAIWLFGSALAGIIGCRKRRPTARRNDMNRHGETASWKRLPQTVALGMLAGMALPAQATSYSFSDLGTVQIAGTTPIMAWDINNLGHIVAMRGTAAGFANGDYYGAIWNGSTWVNQPAIESSNFHEFLAINDHDQITGAVHFSSSVEAYRSDNGSPVALERYSPTTVFQYGTAINNHGQVLGNASTDVQAESVFWNTDGTKVQLPSYGLGSSASSLNDSGLAVGSASDAAGDFFQAIYWDQAHNIHTLPTLTGEPGPGWAADINNLGQIVGTLNTPDLVGIAPDQAVLWNSPSTAPELIPTLPDFDSWVVTAINDHGQMVGRADGVDGSHIFLWDHDTITDLSQLLPAELVADGWQMAADNPRINNSGQIAGYMYNSDNTRIASYLITPTTVPVPGAVWLFGSALAGLGVRQRRSATEQALPGNSSMRS